MDTIPTRISLQSHLGTLRYRGPIPVWPNTTALGIEWDDDTRGKHSGSHNGVTYFETSVPNSATFVKAGRKFDEKQSFLEALKERYAPDEVDELEKIDIMFGNKVAERVGFDKIRKLQA
jgi:dynactin complex subunit